MSADWKRLLTSLSRDELQRLLNAKEEIEILEQRRQALHKELEVVEKDLARLVSATGGRRRTAARRKVVKKAGSGTKATRKKATKKKATKKRATKKKATKKKVTKKAVAKKTPAKKTAAKKTAAKKTTRKTTKKSAAKMAKDTGRQTLEEVVMGVLRDHGEPMQFKVLRETIVSGGLFKSRSKNFDNVLRRTLSTSKRIKHISRGVYGL